MAAGRTSDNPSVARAPRRRNAPGAKSVVVAKHTFGAWFRRLPAAAFNPVDIAYLAYFRIVFGLIMVWEVYRYFSYGWIERYYMDPYWNFPYVGFEWVRPWPGIGMYIHFYALAGLALCFAFGLWYRVTAPLFFFGFTYVFLLEKANYLNHFYLVCLLAFLMIFLPANRAFALDSLDKPRKRLRTVPAWTRWLLLGQISIVYFFGGIAKLNSDWLRGEPMRMWLANRTDFPLIGQWFTDEWMVSLMSHGGLLFDLLIVPALLWRPTRIPASIVCLVFHLTNAELFSIGIFPWFMIAAIPIFYPPQTMRIVAVRMKNALPQRLSTLPSRRTTGLAAAPAVSSTGTVFSVANASVYDSTGATFRPSSGAAALTLSSGFSTLNRMQRWTFVLVAAYLAFQVLFPLRHYLYPGNVSWTEEGHNWAWHMKLRSKGGQSIFLVTDRTTNQVYEVEARDWLSPRQAGTIDGQPDMIVQFAHFIADEYADAGIDDVEVRVWAVAYLNDRPEELFIDPTIDLLTVGYGFMPVDYILPLRGDGVIEEEYLQYAPRAWTFRY